MQNDTSLNNSIKFKGVEKIYPHSPVPAARDISFEVAAGEFISIIGPSGCGKSTILRLIAGLEAPTAGTLEKPEEVSMVFQTGALFPWLTAFDNVAIGLRAVDVPEARVSREVMRYMTLMNITELAAKYPAEVSSGERQRIGIARALAINPSVLLLDEPFSALDPKMTADLHNDLIKIWKETKKTIVMVSHLIEEAVLLSNRVILMKNGSIEKIFPVDLPYPRREHEAEFAATVLEIRGHFFK